MVCIVKANAKWKSMMSCRSFMCFTLLGCSTLHTDTATVNIASFLWVPGWNSFRFGWILGFLQVRDSGQPDGRSPETDGWMRKTWCHCLAVSFLWHSAQRTAVVSYVSVHKLLPKISSGLGGDPRGNHLLTDHGTCPRWFVFTSNYIGVMWNAALNILSAL